MDLPRFEHLAWIRDHEDEDLAHLDWSSVLPVDPADLSTDPPELSAGQPGGLDDDRRLRAMLAQRYDVPRDHVLVTLGATEALVLTGLAVLDDDRRALVERPAYRPLVELPRLAGARIDRFDRRFEDGFRVPVDDLAARLDDVDLVVLTNLHNPTGVGIGEDALDRLMEAAADAGAHVLVDEVYRRSAFGRTAVPAAGHRTGISVDSLTKFFGYGNVRVGWTVGPPDVVERARRAKDLLNPEMVPQGLRVAEWVLEHEAELTRHAKARLDGNRELVETWIDQHDVAWVPPAGGNVCAPAIPDGWDDDVAFAKRALEEDVCVVPGTYLELPGHVRVGYGVHRPMLEEGLKRLSGLYG